MQIVFLGTGGSVVYGGTPGRVKYGSNTPSVAVRVGNETLIFDAGTGICGLKYLTDFMTDSLNLFFSHYHIDHIEGLFFVGDVFDRRKKWTVYGHEFEGKGVREILRDFFQPPYFPLGFEGFTAEFEYCTVKGKTEIVLNCGAVVSVVEQSHPGGAVGYRVDYEGKGFVYMTDIEFRRHKNHEQLRDFARGADLLVLDSFFDDEGFIADWGHSTWRECARFAVGADVKCLALFHWNVGWTDEMIEEAIAGAKEIFPDTFAATDGLLYCL